MVKQMTSRLTDWSTSKLGGSVKQMIILENIAALTMLCLLILFFLHRSFG